MATELYRRFRTIGARNPGPGGAALGVALVTLSVLSACQTYEPAPIEPARLASTLQQRSLDDAALRRFVASNLPGVNSTAGTLTWDLDALTLAAYYFQPELDLARAQWAVTEAERITAGERPGRGANITPGRNTSNSLPSPRLVSATVDLTLETAGKRGYRIARAVELSEAARLNVATVAWQVQSRVRRSLLDLYGARESRQLLLEQQALRADSVRILEGQYAAGTISAFELTQARLAADSAALALSDARRREAEARAQLAGAIGIPDRALENASLVFDQFTSLPAGFDADAARQDALLNRSDVLAALAEYAASQALLQLEIARQYPDVQLGPGYEYDQGDNKWSLGVSLSLPADRNRGPIAEAQARREEAAARFNAVQAGVLAEIDLAVAAWRAASATREESNAMLGELTRQQQTAEGMLAAGAISGAELAALKVQTSAAALVRLDALLEAQRALGQLQDAVQRPLGLPDAVWEQSPRRFADTGEDSNR